MDEKTERARRRPWRARVWFYRPSWYWDWYFDPLVPWYTRVRRLAWPFGTGGDEWGWHTVWAGWDFTGQVIVATRKCPQTGKCADEPRRPDWPSDPDATALDWKRDEKGGGA